MISGLHTLVDPVAEDFSVVVLLNDFISHVLETFQKSQGEHNHGNKKFLCHTLDFLTYLQYYYSRNAGNNCLISDILSQLRQLLVLVSESLYVSTVSCICLDATENTITVPKKTRNQLRELSSRMNNVTHTIVTLQNSTRAFLKFTKTRFLNMSEEDHLGDMTKRSKEIIDQLEGCQVLLAAACFVVKERVQSERMFYNTSSLAVGAVCVGMNVL